MPAPKTLLSVATLPRTLLPAEDAPMVPGGRDAAHTPIAASESDSAAVPPGERPWPHDVGVGAPGLQMTHEKRPFQFATQAIISAAESRVTGWRTGQAPFGIGLNAEGWRSTELSAAGLQRGQSWSRATLIHKIRQ